jgi:membrane protein implicated in regulation of membrane protease activity
MSLALTANIVFDAIIFAVIVGMLAWAIHRSRLEHALRPAEHRVTNQRARVTNERVRVAREHRARTASVLARPEA